MYWLVWLMVLHFIADFILQSREMGKKKSSEPKWLLKHLGIQLGVMFIGLAIPLFFNTMDTITAACPGCYTDAQVLGTSSIVALIVAFRIAFLNALIHGLIDWNIWKLYKISAYLRIKKEAKEGNFGLAWIAESGKNWQYWEDHWFYTTIGFDQLLHVSTLLLLAGWLLKF